MQYNMAIMFPNPASSKSSRLLSEEKNTQHADTRSLSLSLSLWRSGQSWMFAGQLLIGNPLSGLRYCQLLGRHTHTHTHAQVNICMAPDTGGS